MARNLLGVLPKLTPQEGNEIVFKLKCFRCEHYQTLRYDDVRQLGLLNLDGSEPRCVCGEQHPPSYSVNSKARASGRATVRQDFANADIACSCVGS
jgi:hypothetical protein